MLLTIKNYNVEEKLYSENHFISWNRLRNISENKNFSFLFQQPVYFQPNRIGKNYRKKASFRNLRLKWMSSRHSVELNLEKSYLFICFDWNVGSPFTTPFISLRLKNIRLKGTITRPKYCSREALKIFFQLI